MDPITAAVTIAIALITSVFGPSIITWVKYKLPQKETVSPLPEAIQLNDQIDYQLESIMKTLKCERLSITQFHNGGHFYPTGKSIQKFSVFYEKVSMDVKNSTGQSVFQNLPTSLFPQLLMNLYTHGEIIILDPNVDKSYELDTFNKEFNIKSMYMLSIYNLQNDFIGILSMSFSKYNHKLTNFENTFLRQKIGVIGTMLTSYLNKKRQ